MPIKLNKKGIPKETDDILKKQKAAMEEARKQQEAQVEAIMEVVKTKVLPELAKNDETINETKVLVESMAVALNQSLYGLMRKTTVGDLEMKQHLSPDYPGREKWEKLIDNLENIPLDVAIESLQWTGAKIDSVIKNENKNRKFLDLNITLEK